MLLAQPVQFLTIEELPQQFAFDIQLENYIFQATYDSCDKALKLIQENNNADMDYIHSLICKAAEEKEHSFYVLGHLWKRLGSIDHKVDPSKFTEYLVQQHILDKQMLIRKNDQESKIYQQCHNGIVKSIIRDSIADLVEHSMVCNLAQARTQYKNRDISLLSLAAIVGSPNTFKYLYINGCKINRSVISNAIKGGNEEIIEFLIQKHCTANNLLSVAIEGNQNGIANWLLDNFICDQITIEHCINSFNTQAFASLDQTHKQHISLLQLAENGQLILMKLMRMEKRPFSKLQRKDI